MDGWEGRPETGPPRYPWLTWWAHQSLVPRLGKHPLQQYGWADYAGRRWRP